VNQDNFRKKTTAKEENKAPIDSFLSSKNPAEIAYAIQTGAEQADLYISFPGPEKFKKKGVILINLTKQPLTKQSCAKEVVILELTRNVLEHLYTTLNEIMGPVMQNPENQIGWTDLVTKDLMEKFNAYVA